MIFYHCANASRSVKLPDGKRVTFEVYKYFAGAWLGVGAVEDPKIIEGLDELTRKPKSGIERITEAEYKECLKKKALPPNSQPLPASPSPSTQPAPLPIQDLAGLPAGRVAKLVENPSAQAAGAVPVVPRVYESIDSVLKLGVVKPAEGSDSTTKPKKDMGEPSARARGKWGKSSLPKYTSVVPDKEEGEL